MTMEPARCKWAQKGSDLEKRYHDSQWGVPEHDDCVLFEMLILEGMQAGLSWSLILNKREHMREVFDGFSPEKMMHYDEKKIQSLMADPGIIRNRLKINALAVNAKAYFKVKELYGSLDRFLWSYVDHKPIVNQWTEASQVPASTPLSDQISADMKRIGFQFIGTTIIYSFMQAVGIVNDHTTDCFCRNKGTEEEP